MKFALGIALFLLVTPVSSTLYGDEQFGDIAGGKFWAFHSGGVSIVNPESCSVERTFTHDHTGKILPDSWSDGVYMEDEDGDHYVVINSGVTVYDGHESLEGGAGEVLFFSTNPQDYDNPVQSKVTIGGRPVHSYAVYTRDEFWSHSDADGFFYIINLGDIKKHTGKPIKAKVDEANHGKLLWDESAHLERHGFATSTGEQHLFLIDMIAQEQIGTYDFSGDVTNGTCIGTHAIAYSSKIQHLYVECSGGGGTLEFDVSSPTAPVFIAQHANVTGALYETPDEDFVVATDKANNALHFFVPNESGSASSIEYVVSVPGHPSTVTFLPVSSTEEQDEKAHDTQVTPAARKLSHSDYIACMPLTENTNRNHMDGEGNVVCDIYNCSGATDATDVANGICHYDDSGQSLQQATIDQIELVKSKAEPFGNVCANCENENNYDNGVCACTPYCGSCADEDYDASNSGVRCVSLNGVVDGGKREADLIKGAGSILQGKPYAYSPQCGFGRTYRPHKRGGIYDASVANFPTNSLQIINMQTQKFHCAVDLSGAPNQVVYVPPQPEQDEVGGLSTGSIVGIAVCSAVSVLIIVGLVWFHKNRKPANAATAGSEEVKHAAGEDGML